MSVVPPIYKETFTIRASEVNPDGTLTLGALGNLFQEVAGNNALQLHFDITDLLKDNLTWVVSRMDITLHQLPVWRQTITVETWPAAGDSFRAYRNYRMLDHTGKLLCTCLSYWAMLNLKTRRPVRIPQEVLDATVQGLEHVTPVTQHIQRPFTAPDSSKKIIVRRADLDMNNHVNNVRYLEWMMETLTPEEIKKIRTFNIHFLRETFVDAHITIAHKRTGPISIEFNITGENGKAIALATATLN